MLRRDNSRNGEDAGLKRCRDSRRLFAMSKRYQFSVVLSAVVLFCAGALILGQHVSAAGEGKITGTVKLDGAAPHMKGIDMSKDPYCSKAHANDTPHLEGVVAGANGGLANVVLYISDWSGPATASTA